MMSLSRYGLVVVLVANLVVDAASARRSLAVNCCQPEYVSSCDCPCPPPCVVECPTAAPVWTESIHCDDYSAAAVIVESDCQGCQTVVPLDSTVAPSTTQQQVPTEAMPEPESSAIEDEPAAPEAATESTEERTVLPPAPLATPEATVTPEPTAPLPGPAETPDPSVVGDRYSNSGETATPQTPADSSPPAPSPSAEGETSDVDDIFGEPTSSPAQESSDPFPAQPAEETPSPEAEDDVDDIFGPSTSIIQRAENEVAVRSEAVENPQASAVAVRAANSDRVDDPVGYDLQVYQEQTSILSSAGGLKSKSFRTWTDNTEKYQCEARLVRVAEQHVVLLRSSGKRVTVTFSRLASTDLQFVHQQIAALRIMMSQEATAAKLAATWTH